MTVTNIGNVVLRDVVIASNVLPPLSFNATAVADSLSLGEVVVMESNITFNNSMIRAPNAVLWTNITATSAAGNWTASASITVVPNRCVSNNTGGPSALAECGSQGMRAFTPPAVQHQDTAWSCRMLTKPHHLLLPPPPHDLQPLPTTSAA